ncbi:MAG: GtrA family protein [Rhodococcus sp. (in: high G+C Gram-positive bacteria)]|uniref:GtrA family protein n=1 Tax=Rhodococcus sp. TaxID=1831 RepID=UPI002AD604C3|nr:GtrA family protein [Rhodococcus sp. (in: high G+C Gram-positive bacteria)]
MPFVKHAEALKFLIVGAITFVVTVVLFFGLKWTILQDKPEDSEHGSGHSGRDDRLVHTSTGNGRFTERYGRRRRPRGALFFGWSPEPAWQSTSLPLWVSSYMLDLRSPNVSFLTENIADFVSGSIIGRGGGGGGCWPPHSDGGRCASSSSRNR